MQGVSGWPAAGRCSNLQAVNVKQSFYLLSGFINALEWHHHHLGITVSNSPWFSCLRPQL